MLNILAVLYTKEFGDEEIIGLPNCAPSHSQLLSPTATHFSRKRSNSQPFFKKSDPLSLIFQEKKPIPTHF